MLYGKLWRDGNGVRHFWSMRFSNKKLYDDTLALLEEIKQTKVSKYKYEWKWSRWQLLATSKLSDFPKDLRPFVKKSVEVHAPEDIITRIENLHKFFDDHLPLA